jgi:hypothetical protein
VQSRVIIGPAKREPTHVLTPAGYALNVVTNASFARPIQNTAERHGEPEYVWRLLRFTRAYGKGNPTPAVSTEATTHMENQAIAAPTHLALLLLLHVTPLVLWS